MVMQYIPISNVSMAKEEEEKWKSNNESEKRNERKKMT